MNNEYGYNDNSNNESGETRVSFIGVLLAPLWVVLKIVVAIGNFFGNVAAHILRWAANIVFALDILVWITCGFDMFLLVLIPVVFCWIFPFIWGCICGVVDGLADIIKMLWHVPVDPDEYKSYRTNSYDDSFSDNESMSELNGHNTTEEVYDISDPYMTKENMEFMKFVNSLPPCSTTNLHKDEIEARRKENK